MLIEPDHQVILYNPALKIHNKFALITLVRKRAQRLVDGSPPLVETDNHKPVSIALHEIALGLLRIREPGSPATNEDSSNPSPLTTEAQALAKALGLQ